MEGQERLTDYHTVITTWGRGAPLKSHLFIQIYRELWGTLGDPTPSSTPQRGKKRTSLPMVTPEG